MKSEFGLWFGKKPGKVFKKLKSNLQTLTSQIAHLLGADQRLHNKKQAKLERRILLVLQMLNNTLIS